MISGFGGDGIIRVFGTDSCCNEGVDGETDSSSRVEEDDGMTLGFSGVTRDYEKKDISRFIADICFVNADFGNNTIGTYYWVNFRKVILAPERYYIFFVI